MDRSFEDKVRNSAPSTWSTSPNDAGAGGWYIAQGLNEVAKAIVEAEETVVKIQERDAAKAADLR